MHFVREWYGGTALDLTAGIIMSLASLHKLTGIDADNSIIGPL